MFRRIPPRQNAGMYSDVLFCDTVSVMGTCAAPKSTWHSGKHDGPLGQQFLRTFDMYFIWYTYFMNQWCLTKFQKDYCVSLCSLLGASYPTRFTKYGNMHHPEINAMAYIRCQIFNRLHTQHTRMHMYFAISSFWFWPKVHMVGCVPTIWYKYFCHNW